jgi:hypothetical protein
MRDKFYKVEGHSNLVKNPNTGVILNVNTADIERAKKRKSAKILKKESEQSIVNEVHQLRSDMNDLKSMLQQLIEKE